jgi:competence protein ComEC
MTLWRSWLFRAAAIPFAAIGLYGAASGEGFDIAVAPGGDAAAVRLPSGELALLGRGRLSFIGEQWLRADADARAPADAKSGVSCDAMGCVARAVDGRAVVLVQDSQALIEDCGRAAILVTSFYAPNGCGAAIVLDRASLAETGAVTLRLLGERVERRMARGPDEDRPWSRAPARRRTPVVETETRADASENSDPLD